MSTTLQLLGALGVFLLGMKLMSEALQRVAGSRLRSVLASMTRNRFSGVLTGFGTTCIVQSSSATTVMVVGFVAAGLLSLTQAIGVIMGANIGTTVTGWIVAFFGFKVKITAYALPAIGIGFVLGFVPREKIKQWGEVLLGFGLLFLGIGLLKDAVPSIDDQAQIAWVQQLAGNGLLSTLAFVGLGTVLTVLLQSSSATMTLTITVAALGWIPYEAAAAMVLGENIGTTATANIASIGSSVAAKRAARVHLMFNIFGVAWALALMNAVLLPVADWAVPGDPSLNISGMDEASAAAAQGVVSTHLALFHTMFNITNTLMMLPFVKQLEKAAVRLVPDTSAATQVTRHLGAQPIIDSPELVVGQVQAEIRSMTERAQVAFAESVAALTEPFDAKKVAAVEDEEEALDKVENEIVRHLSAVAKADLDQHTADLVPVYVTQAHKLERIGDRCRGLVGLARQLDAEGVGFTDADKANIRELGALVTSALANLHAYLDTPSTRGAMAERFEAEIDATRNRMRSHRIARMKSGNDIVVDLAFIDAITLMEEVGDGVVAVVRNDRDAGLTAIASAK